MEKTHLTIGGQAVIEGVMIKSPDFVSIAVRRPNGTIAIKHEAFKSLTQKVKVLSLPILRGIVVLIEMMVIGMRALDFSVQKAIPEDEDQMQKSEPKKQSKVLSGISFIISIIISLALGLFLFKFIPLYFTGFLQKFFPILEKSVILFNITDGLIRIAIFFLYIYILSLIPAFYRIFEYHGAEHKTIFAYEKGHELTVENAKKESPRHPRCGTSFIIIVLIIGILILSLVPKHPVFWINLVRRISILPLIVGVSYEILKVTAKYEHSRVMKWLTYPGLLTQYITTKEPDEKQMEVAIVAVKSAVGINGFNNLRGSLKGMDTTITREKDRLL